MTNNITSAVGIFAAIVVALVISIAGGQSGMEIWGLPMLFVFGAAAFLTQWAAFVPAYIYQTEKYFDLIGSLTYITLAVVGLVLSNKDIGSIIIALMVLVWAIRLGSFLFARVQKVGHDSRFTKIKPDFLQYLMTWTLQGLWVFLTFAAGLTALTSGKSHPVDIFVIAGSLLWIIGFSIEVIADGQKSKFRSDAANKGKFIQQGLWARSRHPNYFGEILLWTGVAITAIPVLEGLQYATLISPIFVFILVTKISGVRMLEHQARRRWGDDPEYNAYQARTPVLLINPFTKGKGKG